MIKSGKDKHEVGSLIEVKKGDWVLTQNDVIIRKISQKQAREINKILEKSKVQISNFKSKSKSK